jgi:GNAT superfamily N-acetyltransferase
VTPDLVPPQPILDQHKRDAFSCGKSELDDWLKQRAIKNQVAGSSRTFVLATADNTVISYYCLAAGAVVRSSVGRGLRQNMPDPIPVIVLGRLAVDGSVRGNGLGADLLADAIGRARQAATVVGAAAMLVNALDEEARAFYLHHSFLPSPVGDMTLMIRL